MIGNVAIRARAFGQPATSILRHIRPSSPAGIFTRLSSSTATRSPSPFRIISGAPSLRSSQQARSLSSQKYAEALRFSPLLYETRLQLSQARLGAHPLTQTPWRSYSDETKSGHKQISAENVPQGQANLQTSTSTPGGKGKSIYDRIPHIGNYHRPTKEELLAAATGFWSRLKIRFKWFSIRSVRPFNSDEIGALFSWVLLGNILWIILGTTTFASLLILLCNTVFAQETLAGWVGNYVTKSSGVKVVFESAIVPRWRGGVITFKNVFVSKRPGQSKTQVSKGSPETAAAAAAAVDHTRMQEAVADEDTNYTQFDLTLDTVNVTLSFTKWFNGQNLLSDVEIKGVRGVIDRTSVHFTDEDVDPKSYRREHNPGDFEIDSFKMDDFLVTVYQPGGFRPFAVSIFTCDIPQLRYRWLFYDFLCANNVSGSFDDSLFTIHPRQMQGPANRRMRHQDELEPENLWKKYSRVRIDALKIDHLNRGTNGPFSWIHEGTVDLIADLMFPAGADDGILAALISELKNTRIAMSKEGYNLAENGLAETIETFMAKLPASDSAAKRLQDKRLLVMDLRLNFHDVRAAVPLLTRDLSYVNSALIRPVVAYINSRNTFIPINCRLAKRLTDFDGSWTLYDSGLLEDLSAETYNAIVNDITDDQARIRRFKKVGLWSLQLAVQALFMGMAGVIA